MMDNLCFDLHILVGEFAMDGFFFWVAVKVLQ